MQPVKNGRTDMPSNLGAGVGLLEGPPDGQLQVDQLQASPALERKSDPCLGPEGVDRLRPEHVMRRHGNVLHGHFHDVRIY